MAGLLDNVSTGFLSECWRLLVDGQDAMSRMVVGCKCLGEWPLDFRVAVLWPRVSGQLAAMSVRCLFLRVDSLFEVRMWCRKLVAGRSWSDEWPLAYLLVICPPLFRCLKTRWIADAGFK